MDLVALGKRIQALRTERSLTLQALADSSEVSLSMLSSVERGEKAPTVVVLDRIAGGLGVRLSRLIEDPERIVVRRAAEQDVVAEDGWERTILTPVVPGVNFEWISVTLPPDCDAGTYGAWAAGSHEFIVVCEGRLSMTIGERAVELDAGDSLYLAADVPHTYANHGDVPCRYFVAALIMRPRTSRD